MLFVSLCFGMLIWEFGRIIASLQLPQRLPPSVTVLPRMPGYSSSMAGADQTTPPRKRWLPRPRFSLRTLVIAALLIGSAAFLYRDWQPWREIAVLQEQPDKALHDDMIHPQTIAVSPDGNYFTTSWRIYDHDREAMRV